MDQQLPEQPNFTQPKADDEITLKDIILKIQEWWSIVWPKKNLIIALSLLIGLSAALYTKFTKLPTYTASYQLFFQEESGGLSGAMRLASSFGLGGGVGSASSSATVQEFITSRNNIAHAMTADLDNGRLIDRYFAEAVEEDEEFTSKFGANQRYTDSVLTQVYLAFNEGVLGASFDEESGVLGFYVTTYDEAFTYDLATQLVQNTESQFKDWKRQKGLSAVRAFQGKVDSLEIALDATLRRLGEYQDQNNSLISAVDKMEQMRLTIDMESLKVAYGEYIKGLEMSKAELMNLEGPFKYFDAPIYPLQKDKGSAAKAGIFGSVITGFLLVLFFIGRVEAKNIMA
ncbi:Wzz/FepE/Etk N-terminal domain-containing protein [Schleiferiaceae bacterium]|nr:Wzz/FepE/Etk N-terminal domain-containing protein [Schleiferiaceae bacterium]